jgi:hypothetical protein
MNDRAAHQVCLGQRQPPAGLRELVARHVSAAKVEASRGLGLIMVWDPARACGFGISTATPRSQAAGARNASP